MCIIIAKPAGVDLPTEEILDNCFTSNRDGIGFAFNRTGEPVTICKGFANVKKLIKMMETFNIGKDHNVLIHFRLATHGKKDQGNCHPFPLTQSLEEMRELHVACEVAVTHNGIFGQMKQSEKYSDTMKFIGNILASPEIIANLESRSVNELIRGYCGHSSKLAFLREQGITTIGDFEKEDGILYSNAQYKSWGNRWNHGKDWCAKHKEWDKCSEEADKFGKAWCYKHQDYDNCAWCKKHKELDDCAHKAKKVTDCCGANATSIIIPDKGRIAVIDYRATVCEWCGIKDDVKYDATIQSNICDNCFVLYVNGHH